jgi:hypothetical protein
MQKISLKISVVKKLSVDNYDTDEKILTEREVVLIDFEQVIREILEIMNEALKNPFTFE